MDSQAATAWHGCEKSVAKRKREFEAAQIGGRLEVGNAERVIMRVLLQVVRIAAGFLGQICGFSTQTITSIGQQDARCHQQQVHFNHYYRLRS